MGRNGKNPTRSTRSFLPFLPSLPFLPFLRFLPFLLLPPLQPVLAQQPSFRTASTELVVLPVVVTEKSDQPVAGLEREQFTVYDDGRPMAIELFSHEDAPVTLGLVIDTSSSMGPKIGHVIVATLRLVRLSNPEDELFVVRFNDDARDAIKDQRFLRAGDGAALEAAMNALVPQGRTALYDALIAGLDRLDEGSRARKVLVVVSDGGDNASHATLDAVLARAKRSNVTIYTIGVYDEEDVDKNPRVLKALAEATGGERFLPRSAGPMLLACEHIAREIRSGYTIGYVPPDRDGLYHRVRVQIGGDRKFTIRTRPGYFAGQR